MKESRSDFSAFPHNAAAPSPWPHSSLCQLGDVETGAAGNMLNFKIWTNMLYLQPKTYMLFKLKYKIPFSN